MNEIHEINPFAWAAKADITMSITLEDRIKSLCSQHGGLRAAARAIQVDVSHLSGIRDGKKNPSTKTLNRLSLKKHVFYTLSGRNPE